MVDSLLHYRIKRWKLGFIGILYFYLDLVRDRDLKLEVGHGFVGCVHQRKHAYFILARAGHSRSKFGVESMLNILGNKSKISINHFFDHFLNQNLTDCV